ncbi:hypothetical protein TR75_06075 [Hydrogenibacillus schlegelii]|uniref:Uncharacterized protein n=1 Tax=Hydrogenibacillus schlegelii TaxID=1484 RepID=A0A132N8D3_HYDSH|nr:hypothetical protein TR75_06075 [Hydrogenibacillus schlegelii]OAR04488.1 hypothetical protein SA87_01850 [Hydrogenibacillus schlegelii]
MPSVFRSVQEAAGVGVGARPISDLADDDPLAAAKGLGPGELLKASQRCGPIAGAETGPEGRPTAGRESDWGPTDQV